MDTEELNWILENIIKNPPKDIKVQNDFDNMTVKIYTHNAHWSIGLFVHIGVILLIPIVFILYGYFEGYYEHIFNIVKGNVVEGIGLSFIIQLLIFFLLPFGTGYIFIKILYNTFYAAFGKIELAFGKQNYIFNGLFKLGKKYYVNWKDLTSFHQYGNFPDVGKSFSSHTIIATSVVPIVTKSNYFISKTASNTIGFDYISIQFKEMKTIKIHPKFLCGMKVNCLFSMLKYFKYK